MNRALTIAKALGKGLLVGVLLLACLGFMICLDETWNRPVLRTPYTTKTGWGTPNIFPVSGPWFKEEIPKYEGRFILRGEFMGASKVQWLMLGIAAVSMGLVARDLSPKRAKAVPVYDPLDSPLMHWSPDDPFTVRDLLNGGVSIWGRTGSAKTTGSGRRTMRAIVSHMTNGLPTCSGLITAPKPEDADDVRKLFTSLDMEDRLLVVNPDGELRLDFIDYAMKSGADTREITHTITTIGETLRGGDNKGRGEDGDMWEQQAERMIYNAVEVVKRGRRSVKATELQRFISTMAYDASQLNSESWKAKFHNQVFDAAFHEPMTPAEKHDLEVAGQYWLGEIPQLASRTRSSIQMHVMQALHVWNSGIVREMTQNTNVSPDDILNGRKWVLVNMPPAKYGNSGALINAGYKYLLQRQVLKRQAKPGDPVVVIWCDEAQQFVTSHDAHYMAQCRSHWGCQVFLTQSLFSLFAALKGAAGRNDTLSLMAQFGTRIFHALGSSEDADFASKLIGNELQNFMSGNMPPAEDYFDAMLGMSKYSSSFSEKFEAIVQPNVFMNGLRTGGKANKLLCDAIVVRSGEPFASGQNWQKVTFKQE
jgi:hypothetical protein